MGDVKTASYAIVVINIRCYMLLGNHYICKYLCITSTSECTDSFLIYILW